MPPDGAAAELIRDAGAGVVVAPDDVDGIDRRAARPARDAGGRGRSTARRCSEEWRTKVSRRTRVEELAAARWSALA